MCVGGGVSFAFRAYSLDNNLYKQLVARRACDEPFIKNVFLYRVNDCVFENMHDAAN